MQVTAQKKACPVGKDGEDMGRTIPRTPQWALVWQVRQCLLVADSQQVLGVYHVQSVLHALFCSVSTKALTYLPWTKRLGNS